MICGAPALPTDVDENKTLHSTVPMLVKSFALPTDVSCTDLTRLPDEHRLSSALHRAVVSAIAEGALRNANATSATKAIRPKVLIEVRLVLGFTASPFHACRHVESSSTVLPPSVAPL